MTMARVRILLYATAACCFLLMGSATAHENKTTGGTASENTTTGGNGTDSNVTTGGAGAVAKKGTNIPIGHIVGGRFGWDLPETNTTFYEDWTKNRVFGIGDTLVFPYRSGGTLMLVDKESYDACKMKNVKWMFFKGPSNYTLNEPGPYYFFSAMGRHCEKGQKLMVNAEAGKQGSTGTRFSFKITYSVDDRRSTAEVGAATTTATDKTVAAAAPKAESPAATEATSTTGSDKTSGAEAADPTSAPTSAASTFRNVGIAASGIFALLFSYLFI